MNYELYDETPHQFLQLKHTILTLMDPAGEMRNTAKETITAKSNIQFNNTVDLRSVIVNLCNFTQRYKGNESDSGSWGYYNDPINVATIFIAIQIRDVCFLFKEDSETITKTQATFQALESFTRNVVPKFPGESGHYNKFMALLIRVTKDIASTRISLSLFDNRLDLQTVIKSCKEKGILIIKAVPLYLVKVLMSSLLGETHFDIKGI